jgi:serine protease 16
MKQNNLVFKTILAVFLCTAQQLTTTNAIYQHRPFQFLNKRRSLSTTTTKNKNNSTANIQELYITQRLDHFRPTSTHVPTRIFQQRYFYSDPYVKKNDTTQPSLAFLCVGGEGPALGKSVLVDSEHCSGDMLEFAKILQKEYNIHLYALEHRYYGQSFPTNMWPSSVSNDNLAYLSSRQAIADIGHFVATISTTINKNTIWIAFGGSYPGMLAAWSRLVLPHLIHGAVSNSAPVQPLLELEAYNAHVAHDWANSNIGGSNECLHVIQQAYVEMERAALNESRMEEVAALFNICHSGELYDERNLQFLLGDNLLDWYMQSNDPSSCNKEEHAYCNVGSVCTALLERVAASNGTEDANMHAYAWLIDAQTQANNTTADNCNRISYDDYMAELSNIYDDEIKGDRSWLWQTCTEFGFYQTCNYNRSCPYGQGWHPLSQDLDICRIAFGVSPTQVARNIEATMELYGGWNLQATRVLSMSGSVDPWSELTLKKSKSSKNLPVYEIPGASHHFWTHPVKATDGKEIQEAREIIFRTLQTWIQEIEVERATVETKNDWPVVAVQG